MQTYYVGRLIFQNQDKNVQRASTEQKCLRKNDQEGSKLRNMIEKHCTLAAYPCHS